jgi:diaminohydroxyphosphoribosylaminopyrimidine deaminase/5-amino-6-(5-phosphoribosylamino)uracil reductase
MASFCQLILDYPHIEDKSFFRQALSEAQKGLGSTHPNPPVGAVIVKNGQVIATGYHAKAGELHAEANALKAAGEQAKGSTLYVTLEPCNHFGRTPPCAQAIIQAGVKKVIFGAQDPNPKVEGGGAQALRAAGVEVEQVSDPQELLWAQSLIQPFATHATTGRPYVLAKIACSLDGKIAFQTGQTTQITGPETKRFVHELREAFDAVGVGARTDQIDHPQLTVRFEDRAARRQPERLVFDSKTPLLEQLDALGARGITSVMIEGGGRLLTALLQENLVDEIAWLTAPKVIGSQGVPALGDMGNLMDYSKRRFGAQLGVDFLNILCHKDPVWLT